MNIDRTEVCNIMSEMFDKEDEYGIYPTTIAYDKLEGYIEKVRIEAIGWMYAYACVVLDEGGDIRTTPVPEILERAKKELNV